MHHTHCCPTCNNSYPSTASFTLQDCNNSCPAGQPSQPDRPASQPSSRQATSRPSQLSNPTGQSASPASEPASRTEWQQRQQSQQSLQASTQPPESQPEGGWRQGSHLLEPLCTAVTPQPSSCKLFVLCSSPNITLRTKKNRQIVDMN